MYPKRAGRIRTHTLTASLAHCEYYKTLPLYCYHGIQVGGSSKAAVPLKRGGQWVSTRRAATASSASASRGSLKRGIHCRERRIFPAGRLVYFRVLIYLCDPLTSRKFSSGNISFADFVAARHNAVDKVLEAKQRPNAPPSPVAKRE